MPNPESVLQTKEFDKAASQIAQVGRFLAERGWSPATSSNYSTRLDQDFIAITRSGIDKYLIVPSDVIVINTSGQVVAPDGKKSSAETLIHTTIYKVRPTAQAVLHTHSPTNTRLSLLYSAKKEIRFQGYEMQKGISDVRSHETELIVPILSNHQDMNYFSGEVEQLLKSYPQIHGFLIAGHGLYTWGKDMTEAQRHIETFEFLFECLKLELLGV